jgi:ribosomal protein S8
MAKKSSIEKNNRRKRMTKNAAPKRIMADHEARDANVGGEILFTVF